MISIIVPIFNQECYLNDCLDSIKNQTYKDFEVLLINDGSTDKSSYICKEYIKDDKRFKYYEKENGGVSSARNLGLRYSVGEWIMFVDPDDKLDENIIQELLLKEKDDYDIIACSCKVFGNTVLCNNSFFPTDMVFKTNKEKCELIKQLFDGSYQQDKSAYTAIGVPWGKLYRKSFFDYYKLEFDEELRRMQDNVLNMNAFWLARAIYYTNKNLYYYRLDNIQGYIGGSYKSFLVKNYITIQKRREDFLIRSKNETNAELIKMLYSGAFSEILGALKGQVFNKHNPNNYLGRKKEYYQLLSDNGYYKKAIICLKLKDVRGLKQRIALGALKTNSFFLCWIVWNLKNVVSFFKHSDVMSALSRTESVKCLEKTK